MRSLSRIAILLILFLFALQIASADSKNNSSISGNIISLSGSPLTNATIKIFREVQEGEALAIVRSNSHGFFKSIDLKPGIYRLQVSHQGYQPAATAKFAIDPGRKISLDIALQEFIDYVSKDGDPRNRNLKTTMQSISGSRLIFHDISGGVDFDSINIAPFYRSGAMSIASNTPLDGESYLMDSQSSQSGVSSNFAITEPVSPHGRMILSGQLDFGSGSFWRMRNTYNYRPDMDNDYRISAGYGQMNYIYPGTGSGSTRLIYPHSDYRESGVETLAFGVEGSTRLLNLMAVKYGFEYSRLHYGSDLSLFHPSIQILITPSDNWIFKTSVSSKRESDVNTVVLTDGEILNLSEPALITMVGNHVNMSQVRHSEFAVQRNITANTDVELATYQDRMQGPGFPLMLNTNTRSELTPAAPWRRQSDIIDMSGKYPIQRGMRITFRHAIANNLKGSVAYIYGGATSIFHSYEPLTVAQMEEKLTNYMEKRYQHSITSQLNVTIPTTKTDMLASMRWNSGNPLTPLDWFSDRMDIGTKSTNFEIRQSVPLPELLGKAGRGEILVDMRNILNQGKEVLQASNGEIILNRSPRSLRVCFNLNFR
jgi:hypothetical protein